MSPPKDRWKIPENPDGHGTAIPPSGGFNVKAQDLVNAAGCWDTVAGYAKEAHTECLTGWGHPGIFGIGDLFYTTGTIHEAFNKKVCDANWDGFVIMGQVADGLVETANDMSNTDKTQGDNFKKYDVRYD